MKKLFLIFVVFPCVAYAASDGDSPPVLQPDKSGFTLFNPTPPDDMREFNTDRPDVTESPYTVDAGHFQAEFSFLEYTRDRDHGDQTDGFSVLPANLKIGVLNNFDLQLILNPYENIRFKTRHATDRNAGFGDTEMRAKFNLWGDDCGSTAGGVMPFVRFPTGTDGLSDHHLEGGLILPLAVELPAGFALGTMAEFDIDHNDPKDRYGLDFVHTVTLDHDLFDRLDGYIEYVGVSPIDTDHTYLAYFDTGVAYMLSKNIQLDAGINIGLSRRADDFTTFAGLSFRI